MKNAAGVEERKAQPGSPPQRKKEEEQLAGHRDPAS